MQWNHIRRCQILKWFEYEKFAFTLKTCKDDCTQCTKARTRDFIMYESQGWIGQQSERFHRSAALLWRLFSTQRVTQRVSSQKKYWLTGWGWLIKSHHFGQLGSVVRVYINIIKIQIVAAFWDWDTSMVWWFRIANNRKWHKPPANTDCSSKRSSHR